MGAVLPILAQAVLWRGSAGVGLGQVKHITSNKEGDVVGKQENIHGKQDHHEVAPDFCTACGEM